MMDQQTFYQFKLQEFITRREGMIAENKQCEALGQSMAYVEKDFADLEAEIRQFAEMG